MTISDYGIILEIFGFVLLFLTANRNPNASVRVTHDHKEHIIDKFRFKIWPDRLVLFGFVLGFSAVILGLIFQFSYFNPGP